MKRRIIYFRILAMLTFLSLVSCQTEELYVEKNHFGKKNGINSSYLKGSDASRVVEMLTNKLNQGSKIRILSSNSAFMRTNEGVIDFENILQVIDTLGIKNYTFKILNHPDDNVKTFHNLVLTEKENALEATIMKYEMSDEFAQNFNANLNEFYEFRGTVSAISVMPSDPCAEVVVNFPGDSGSDVPDNPTGSNPSNNYSSSSGCTTIDLSFVCTDCQAFYATWESYKGSVCGNGNYGLNIIVTYIQTISCRNIDDPCNPGGAIGVLQPQMDCNTSKEALMQTFPNLSEDNAQILANMINQYGSSYGINTNYKLRHFLSQIAHETGGLSNLNIAENFNFSTANRLMTVFGKYFSYTDPNKENPDTYLNNPSKVGSFVYKNRMGNGNAQSQEGYKYRGRGLIQLSGKENYQNFQNHYIQRFGENIDLITNPELITNNTELAIISAMWFFKNNVIDKTSLRNNIDSTVLAITHKVNGGENGFADRVIKHNACVQFIDCITQ